MMVPFDQGHWTASFAENRSIKLLDHKMLGKTTVGGGGLPFQEKHASPVLPLVFLLYHKNLWGKTHQRIPAGFTTNC